jgi:hypothetical protein
VGDERVGQTTERILTCECGHFADKHDSGGCCREAFCPCSAWRPKTLVMIGEETSIPNRHAGYLPPHRIVCSDLGDFRIETASYADLARWAYKARDFIRKAV